MEKRLTFTVTKRMMIATVVGITSGVIILVLVVGALINPTDPIVLIVYRWASIPPLALVGGWVLKTLWNWFMVPIFGLPKLSILAALGVWIVTGLLTFRYQPVQDGTIQAQHIFEVLYETIQVTLALLLILGFGWVVHLFYKKSAN